MADTIQLMIGNVIDPTYLIIPAYTSGGSPSEPPIGFLEVYAGAITLSPDGNYVRAPGLNDNSPGQGFDFCRIIIPMGIKRVPGNPDADTMLVRSYGRGDVKPLNLQMTVCVSLAGTAPTGTHTALESVERSEVHIEPNELDGDTHQVLVLGFQTAHQWTTLLRVTYTITVTGQDIGPHPVLDPQALEIVPAPATSTNP